ncbi:dehydration-responsive element-binding protein 1B-like [Cornus florida]|uniref:dehydration-responsive element-binding protein 1B-like n=1 Tax=Cornus florida TaxID=4283 RepID=UPI002896939F|nr:dehydration-responsive element-binding protein 1B-like [Cornus florida]
MDHASSDSDPHPFWSNSRPSVVPDTPSTSNSDTRRATHSDEEVILASSRPKKRAGRKKFKETRHPVYRGVRQRNTNRWVCELREPNRQTRIWLGTYPTAEMAARAHDVAALALKGHGACLNFADSVWCLPLPSSKDAKDIRKAAAEAAEEFRPRDRCDNTSGGEARQEASDGASSSKEVTGNVKTFPENEKTLRENVSYVDEEAMFDMPGLLVNMAEGLLISPPSSLGQNFSGGDMESDVDVPLWSYSI